jgi:thymidylate synthase
MNFNHIFDGVNDGLPVLMGELLSDGDEFGSRSGRTKELMHVGITLRKPWQREIVLPERKASVAAQIVETMWVLSGRTDVAGLAPYLPRAVDFSDDGKTWRAGYGARLRNYHGVDQLDYIVKTMTESPGSRQAVAAIWDPTVDTQPGKDKACNVALSFSSRFGNLDLHVFIRSNDAMWGWSGINAFEWSVLQEVVASLAGLSVGSLHFSTTSFHLYEQHWDKARRISRAGGIWGLVDSPRFAGVSSLEDFDILTSEWFVYEALIRTGQPVDVAKFPEPMMRSWLRVLQWYWSADEKALEPLRGTRLYAACQAGVAPAGEPQEVQAAPIQKASPDEFVAFVNKLHAEKHAAYGDSWKRRGELGILGNIARKIDRIGSGVETSDETQTDTAIDLLVYLVKFYCWLFDKAGDPSDVAEVLAFAQPQQSTTDTLVTDFGVLETGDLRLGQKQALVYNMVERAYGYALSLWG